MKLLERYLREVRFWLPKQQSEDILTELSDDIRSQIEERESEIGRTLSETELEALLQKRGHPLVVAQKYSPQRALIGPVLFPVYKFVLKIVAFCYVIPWFIVWVCYAFVPSYRAAHPGLSLLSTLSPLWLIAIYCFGIITIVFACLDRAYAKFTFLQKWNPRNLPAERDPNRISRSASLGELTGSGLFLVLWMGLLYAPPARAPHFGATDAVIHEFFWPVLIFQAAVMITAGIHLLHPWWTRRRAGVRLAVDLLGIGIVCFAIPAGKWIEIVIPGGSPAAVARLEGGLNNVALVALIGTAIVLLVNALQHCRRLAGKPPYRHWALSLLTGE